MFVLEKFCCPTPTKFSGRTCKGNPITFLLINLSSVPINNNYCIGHNLRLRLICLPSLLGSLARLMTCITGVLVPYGLVKHSNDGTGVFDRKYLLTNLISCNAGKSKKTNSLLVVTTLK